MVPLIDKEWGNYLRVRGEYGLTWQYGQLLIELPPRARRIPNIKEQERLVIGTTSACAENTATEGTLLRILRNYLRVRGEYQPLGNR